MRVYNTMTRQKEELIPIEEGKIRLYACGPTVYNFIHIGNARPLVVFDTLRRYLEWRGYEVNFVQNFTDIDDKIIRRANEEGTDYKTVAERYIEEYWVDAKGLGVREANIHPKATETMDEIITALEQNGDGFIKAMWCGDSECEDKLKEETGGVKSRCIPFVEEHLSDVCVCCGKPAKHMVYWGKQY